MEPIWLVIWNTRGLADSDNLGNNNCVIFIGPNVLTSIECKRSSICNFSKDTFPQSKIPALLISISIALKEFKYLVIHLFYAFYIKAGEV